MAALDSSHDARAVAISRWFRGTLGPRDWVSRLWTAITGTQSTETQLPSNNIGG